MLTVVAVAMDNNIAVAASRSRELGGRGRDRAGDNGAPLRLSWLRAAPFSQRLRMAIRVPGNDRRTLRNREAWCDNPCAPTKEEPAVLKLILPPAVDDVATRAVGTKTAAARKRAVLAAMMKLLQ
mmetsp:Transcript_40155/g.65276  ORF Transcript_40155/g.65276 Transcript_40155/m.65276 type:complete len:125 (-) Transcript_40155:125-499(-)